MWHLDHELEKWFEDVEAKRKEKWGTGRDDDREDVPMMQNELTAGKRGN